MFKKAKSLPKKEIFTSNDISSYEDGEKTVEEVNRRRAKGRLGKLG